MQNLSYEKEFDLHENEARWNTFSYEWFHTKTRFDKEGKATQNWPIGSCLVKV